MKKYAKEKNVNYLKNIGKSITKSEDYKGYSEKFKEDENVIGKYLVKISLDLPGTHNYPKEMSKKEKKIDIMEKTGEYLEKVQKLKEIKKEYNNSIIKETSNFLGEKENPFIISKKQLEMEFSKMRNEKISEEELQVKSLYWEDKLLETVTDIKEALYDKEIKRNGYEDKSFKRDIVNRFNNKIINLNFEPLDVYENYIKGKITREELENNEAYDEIKKYTNTLYKNKYNTNEKENLDFLLENKIMNSIVNNRYLIKDVNLMKTIELASKGENSRISKYKEDKENNNSCSLGVTLNGYNTEYVIDVSKKLYDTKIDKKYKLDYKNLNREKAVGNPTLLCKYTTKQLNQIEKLEENRDFFEDIEIDKIDSLVRNCDVVKKDKYVKQKEREEKNIDDERGAR